MHTYLEPQKKKAASFPRETRGFLQSLCLRTEATPSFLVGKPPVVSIHCVHVGTIIPKPPHSANRQHAQPLISRNCVGFGYLKGRL